MNTLIPQELRARHQWICWRYQIRGGTTAKIPIDPRRRTFASSTNPDTWTNFLAASYAYENERRWLDGVSFAFSRKDMYYGVDLDNCVRKDGSFTDFAEEVVFGLNSYTEVSPSGRGLKIFCKINPGEKLPETFKGRNGWPIEVYSHSRFFTCTGKHIIDTPLTVNASSYTEHFIALANAERPDGTPVQQDREFDVIYDADEDVVDVVLAIINSRVATKFLRFQEGDTTGYPSASEADFALMGLLSFFTNNNIPLMLKIAETTGLKRPKWRTRRNGVNYLHYIAKIVVGRTTGRPTT